MALMGGALDIEAIPIISSDRRMAGVPVAPADPAELLEPAELLGDADPADDDPAGTLVTAGLGPAGALGENERRMDS